MSPHEKAILQATRALAKVAPSRNQFRVDRSATVFTGLVQQESFASEAAIGGRMVDTSLSILAEREQFDRAGVTLKVGMGLKYAGREWAIVALPNIETMGPAVTIECELPTKVR